MQAQHRVSIMSSFKILKVPIVKINQPISQCNGIEYLTTKTKEETGTLYSPPISDCLYTENRLFPNKTTFWAHRNSPASRFKNFTANFCTSPSPPMHVCGNPILLIIPTELESKQDFKLCFELAASYSTRAPGNARSRCKAARPRTGLYMSPT